MNLTSCASSRIVVTRRGGGNSSTSSSISFNITKVNHGFVPSDLPLAVYNTALGWELATANSKDTLATHIIVGIVNSNTLSLAQIGRYELKNHGLIPDAYYYTSSTQAGKLTNIEPPYFSNPMILIEDANYIHILSYRPSSINGAIGGGPVIDTFDVDTIVTAKDPTEDDQYEVITDENGNVIVQR